MGLWAPAAMNGMSGTHGNLGNIEWLNNCLEIARREGVFLYPNTFDDRIIPLGVEFFEQCMASRACDYLAEFEGNVVMVCGSKDDIIPLETLNEVASHANPNANFLQHVVEGANHGFGAWTNEPHQMEELVEVTSRFIIDVL